MATRSRTDPPRGSGSAGDTPRPTPHAAQSRACGPWIVGVWVALAGLPGAVASAQTAVVQASGENLRAEPSGRILAVVHGATALDVVGERERWREVVLEGWVWALSVGPTGAGSLQVDVADGENLRAEPNGRILARLRQGAVLEELRRQGRWVLVRRRAWMWAASLRTEERTAPARPARPDPPTDTARAVTRRRVAGDGVTLRAQPDSTALATLGAGVEVEVLERRGGWARVRLEGWIPAPPDDAEAEEAPLAGVTVMELADHPERYQGKRLAWTVQFISLEHAERIRTEFYEGEPFLLARGPGEDRPIVYLAVPPELLARAQVLEPLDRLEVVGRVRTPRSPLTGAPVLDLQEIR
jgi:hypothetical protein